MACEEEQRGAWEDKSEVVLTDVTDYNVFLAFVRITTISTIVVVVFPPRPTHSILARFLRGASWLSRSTFCTRT
jgi:hypothetical protein